MSCKLSGLVTEADPATWQVADLAPFVEIALETFGPSRLLFGSDWPVCLLAASYADVVAAARDLTAGLSTDRARGGLRRRRRGGRTGCQSRRIGSDSSAASRLQVGDEGRHPLGRGAHLEQRDARRARAFSARLAAGDHDAVADDALHGLLVIDGVAAAPDLDDVGHQLVDRRVRLAGRARKGRQPCQSALEVVVGE